MGMKKGYEVRHMFAYSGKFYTPDDNAALGDLPPEVLKDLVTRGRVVEFNVPDTTDTPAEVGRSTGTSAIAGAPSTDASATGKSAKGAQSSGNTGE